MNGQQSNIRQNLTIDAVYVELEHRETLKFLSVFLPLVVLITPIVLVLSLTACKRWNAEEKNEADELAEKWQHVRMKHGVQSDEYMAQEGQEFQRAISMMDHPEPQPSASLPNTATSGLDHHKHDTASDQRPVVHVPPAPSDEELDLLLDAVCKNGYLYNAAVDEQSVERAVREAWATGNAGMREILEQFVQQQQHDLMELKAILLQHDAALMTAESYEHAHRPQHHSTVTRRKLSPLPPPPLPARSDGLVRRPVRTGLHIEAQATS